MINRALTKVFGSQHERDIKRMQPTVAAINDLEPEIQALSNEQLRAKTDEFRGRLADGESLEDLLIEAFAVVREAAWRTVQMRHYDVQLIGGIVLHQGRIAEMKTGEGKTLVATLAVYLNALAGKGVHVVTVNDYLARRDAEWMGKIYNFLGMKVGIIQHGLTDEERRDAYNADITYATNNELGFDYLRDNMKLELSSMVQRPHHYAIVDEVDSILIDEARTPLIISGPSEESVDKYYSLDRVIPKLQRGEEIEEDDRKYTTGDFLIDEKAKTVTLTEEGVAKVEKILSLENLYDIQNMEILHGINQGLRAHHLFKRDVDYLMKDGQVVIVDEFTGRMMPGRRWSDGLHQAIEAKEGVRIERENQTLATITFQNYFRMYDKLAGMTGTAETEATEFGEIYELDVTVIPTNKPMIRADQRDVVFRTANEKWNAVVEDIQEKHEIGQPVLVGTASIETSEGLAKRLKAKKIPHVVLNAKYHGKEAAIVAQAGRKGSVTIATNMAGRGTDIVLGGNPEGLAAATANPAEDQDGYEQALARYGEECSAERQQVLDAGGLYILGTERHESRRVDNQLRGRSGRQGDPGESRFYLSLEDDLMRIFASDRVTAWMGKLGMEEGEAIEAGMVTRAIERAQTQVEGRNFEIRKHLLEYDDVMNKQREAIYQLRREILEGEEERNYVDRVTEDIIDFMLENHCHADQPAQEWDLNGLSTDYLTYFDIAMQDQPDEWRSLGLDELRQQLLHYCGQKYDEKEGKHGAEAMRGLERRLMLSVVDRSWKDHLLALDHLKEGIGLRAHGQRNPLQEYKKESFDMFQALKDRVEDEIIKNVYRAEPISPEELAERLRQAQRERMRRISIPSPTASRTPQTVVREGKKVGRNDPCPCGSGKKYKKCHGAAQAVSN